MNRIVYPTPPHPRPQIQVVNSNLQCEGYLRRAFQRSKGWKSHDGISALRKERKRAQSLSFHPVRTQQEGGCLQARKRVCTEPSQAVTLTWNLPAFRTVRNTCLSFKPPSLGYFATAAQAKTVSMRQSLQKNCCLVLVERELCISGDVIMN